MGNLKTLKRLGWTSASPSLTNNTGLGTMDDLTYQYANGGNQLTNVADNNASDTYGFKDVNGSGTEYTYDQNGNMKTDANKGITSISYNHLNLPTNISINGNGNNGTIGYIYDATGAKLKKTVGSSVTEYAGNHIYENGSLQFFNHPEGYVTPNGSGGYDYVYQYKDHLGNVRLSFIDNNGTTEIVEENNYYPFGLKHKGYNEAVSPLGNSVANKWKFGGKEYQDELDLAWYDVSARNYDPALGRWMNIDPLADQMRRHSPYNYAFDNPVYWMDYDGMSPSASTSECPDCQTQEDWDNYYAQIDNAAGTMGFGSAQEMALNFDHMEMTMDENGNQILMVNGEPLNLTQHENRISALGEFFAPLVEGVPKAIANLFKGKSATQTAKVTEATEEVVDTATKTKKSGGRLGGDETRAQNRAIADELEARGYEITGGGDRVKEEYLRPIDGGRKGGSYPDITATKDGRTLRVNTVDTKKSGAMTKREAENAARIRAQRPFEHLLIIPKKK